jgi:hypothetical protein
MKMDRRRFLQIAALGVVSAVAFPACERGGDTSDAAGDQPELLGMLGPERVRELGNHYRAATPAENSADALRARLSSTDGWMHIPFIGHRSIGDQVRADFAGGRTVLVDGWILSVTEARQAALFSLRAS